MKNQMSLYSRKELTLSIHNKYALAGRKEKTKIIDGFMAATGYGRKYAIGLLNSPVKNKVVSSKARSRVKYDETVQQALITVWLAANQICGKRLVPFLPEFVHALERCGHLHLDAEVVKKLLTLSPATADRLLKKKRNEDKPFGISTTKPGGLLKKQIPIRTFADWDDIRPGFLEIDLVAHCGDRVDGIFLNTLVLTDIGSTWTEFIPLLQRNETNVIAGLTTAQELIPFPMKGLDSDNGSEFINYKLLAFCERHKITFTRSRAYRKNDQAHVEEKNGSIVRRLIGYDRYEGEKAWEALSEVYAVLRLYSNFFQPCMKLISKQRQGSKVKKYYDKAQTPCQRLLSSAYIGTEIKQKLQKQYENLDPLYLLKQLELLQNQFWKYAWKDLKQLTVSTDKELLEEKKVLQTPVRRYRRTAKPRIPAPPRTWRTRKDIFKDVWGSLSLYLQVNQRCSAKELLLSLIKEHPQQFSLKHLRTLERRIKEWRVEQSDYERIKKLDGKLSSFLSLAEVAAK